VQRKLARGEPPTDELLDGGLLIAAGAFLLTPGLVTDAVGFLFAFPLSRVPIRVALKKYVVVPYLDSETGGFTTGNVYVGGFPGDGGGFTMGGSFGGGFDGTDDVGRSNDSTERDTAGSDSATSAEDWGGSDDADDVVDVDYTVEDDESKRTD
ncbi:FxsA family protein, partial [Halorubrum pallidum]